MSSVFRVSHFRYLANVYLTLLLSAPAGLEGTVKDLNRLLAYIDEAILMTRPNPQLGNVVEAEPSPRLPLATRSRLVGIAARLIKAFLVVDTAHRRAHSLGTGYDSVRESCYSPFTR